MISRLRFSMERIMRLRDSDPLRLRTRGSFTVHIYGGPKVSRQFQFHHGNFNFTTAISTSFTAISTLSRQFQFHHGNFNFVHGNFNFVTAISISPRQFQFCSRQFQLHHGNFNFTTTISILSRQFQLRSRQFQFQFHHRESTKVVKKK